MTGYRKRSWSDRWGPSIAVDAMPVSDTSRGLHVCQRLSGSTTTMMGRAVIEGAPLGILTLVVLTFWTEVAL